MKNIVLLIVIFLFPVITYSANIGENSKIIINSQIKSELKYRLQIQKKWYKDFYPVYIHEHKNAVRVIYTAISINFNKKFESTNKWLHGYTFRKQKNGNWTYVGGRSTMYINETNLEKMKKWAKEIIEW